MANLSSRGQVFQIDDSTASIANISAYVNNVTVDSGQTVLDDSALGDTQHTTLPGLTSAQGITVNGMVNTTTRAIFAPLFAAGTSITKSIDYAMAAALRLTGECWFESGNFSGNVDTLQTFSATFRAENGLTSTSVALS